jgi:hypothetical protein
MSIKKLNITPPQYFHFINDHIFINYNHNRISDTDDRESKNIFMTHVLTTKIVSINEPISIKNGDSIINLTVKMFARSNIFPLTIIKLTDEQFELCRSVKYVFKYGRLRDGDRRYNLNFATYNLDLVFPNKLNIIYNYTFNNKRDSSDLEGANNFDDFVDSNKRIVTTNVIFVTTEPGSRRDPIKSVNILRKDILPSFTSVRDGSLCFDINRRCYGIILNEQLILSKDIIDFIRNATYIIN